MTRNRTRSNFSASQSATLQLLDRELWHLGGKNIELLVAIEPQQFRLDGYPRSTAKAAHPGIILSLDSKFGHLSYPCDTFDRWEDNLRGIALALEALRKVDRYGVTKRGEQYRGFLALEATAMPSGFASADEAEAFLKKVAGGAGETLRRTLSRAQFMTHPDHGGDASIFQRVTAAESKLRAEGRL